MAFTACCDFTTLNLDGVNRIVSRMGAAFTVREFLAGRGAEVGGGDGLGTIVLPRPIPDPISAVLHWPEG